MAPWYHIVADCRRDARNYIHHRHNNLEYLLADISGILSDQNQDGFRLKIKSSLSFRDHEFLKPQNKLWNCMNSQRLELKNGIKIGIKNVKTLNKPGARRIDRKHEYGVGFVVSEDTIPKLKEFKAIKILISGFNAKIGKENIYRSAIGLNILYVVSNDNETRLINLYLEKGSTCSAYLVLKENIYTSNRLYKHKGCTKSVRSYKDADSDSDHYLMEKGKKKENRSIPYRIKTVSQWRHYGYLFASEAIGLFTYLSWEKLLPLSIENRKDATAIRKEDSGGIHL
ncbi:hypothetical protein AGLY_007744 [Aphis glycines]|uniref:PiggyBac transposable element-derived protein domain-containing protein n=1 Tax=Aphis glycines TaxID=307491 RepID=A0A6G0TP50_APHGL|nr:hypothetical protein AGLY_007744 [Aphis glycines]